MQIVAGRPSIKGRPTGSHYDPLGCKTGKWARIIVTIVCAHSGGEGDERPGLLNNEGTHTPLMLLPVLKALYMTLLKILGVLVFELMRFPVGRK